ncbi:hypothetical protein CBF34_00100 [Vagococcus penaei]|uniref:Uncharacterized protein n=1 Tax=Vagococcus penaei TaxID=633807 RepID=A0A1Q2D540_9ENTE|nr:DEAD/DEAH box helicase [Vagococcus penaei]AQP53503.1 hypothetical protein BW732_04175 [Vagococcus penaei]RSU07448.1 hypothetical protein CBF34_00100 [Vagococcus penaei]
MKWSIPEKIVEEGREYAKDGRVVSISKNEEQQVWYADVIGSEVFHVELDGTAKEEDVCQCQYWHQHNNFCKHTVAVELALREKGLNRYIKKQVTNKSTYQAPTPAEILTTSFEHVQESVIDRMLLKSDPLKIEWTLEVIEATAHHPEQSVIGLSAKIGRREPGSRLYIVKNIKDLLWCYEFKGVLLINDNHYVISDNSFTKRDDQLLERLVDITHNQEMFTAAAGVQPKGKISKRYVILDKEDAKYFINQLMTEERLLFIMGEEKKETLLFKQNQIPLELHVSPVGVSDYQLDINDHIELHLEKYQWLIARHSIYEIDSEQSERYQLLRQVLKRVPQATMRFNEKTVGGLFSYIIPNLESIATVKMSDTLTSEMIRFPLETKLSIDSKRGQLQVRVDFIYGEYVFSSDSDYSTTDAKQGRVVRNQVRETQIEKLLEHFGYTKRGLSYMKNMPNGERLYQFFKNEIPLFQRYATVELSDALNHLFVEPEEYQPKISILDEGSWLDINFDISNIGDEEVNDVLISLMKHQEYHQLKSGQLIFLDDDHFKQTSQVLQKLRHDIKIKKGKLTVPKYRGLLVNQIISQTNDVETSDSVSEMVTYLSHPETYPVTIPTELQATLRDYQEVGFKWLKMLSHYQFGGILADDMGLGKTLQLITYLLSEKADNLLTQPSLIVAPASLLFNWKKELARFAPSLKTMIVMGSKAEREALIEQMPDVDILITSYTTLRQDSELYQATTFHSLVLDEAQMVKNAATKTFQSIEILKAKQKFALSGTPIENKLEELWALFKLIMPGFFPALRQFKKLPTETIAMMIQPFVLRREKKEVLKDLPDKVETDLYSQLTDEQKKVYLAFLQQMQEQVSTMTDADLNRNRLSILSGLTRLRQICCEPSLFLEDYTGGSGKLTQTLELVQTAKANGKRMLLFSQFTSMLSILEEEFEKIGISTFYLRGSTPIAKRQEMVERFNRGENDVFLISLKAGGTGLNLTGADTVILYDLWWNPAVEDQATGRAHRMGQTRKVEVWRLISEGTIEEKMHQLQATKKELFDQVMNAEDVKPLAQMTVSDLKSILDIGE